MLEPIGITITQAIPKTKGKRRVVRMQNTYSSNNASLDHPSNMALKWIDKWIAERGGDKFPYSAIIRRALAVYVAELEATSGRAVQSALRAVKSSCVGSRASVEEQDEADKRLREPGVPLKPFKVVLHGQYKVDQDKAMMAHMADVEARIDAGTYYK